ncbi:hypothetical protein PAHAL_4G185600 [Panicum hallii]|uniref:Uncharacterized protein n=1 Tax=Panicum hallii TaxID=206008 RepID=A0A2T8JDD7_9POAL|nr:uncharacterized protein LOC112889737 [Panicum hallii]PVH47918.1 hypothetical protein PAHAL_4G185600 [Panicum hallii]PVH47921.1 hypothetical protein PAHAL_4G185600 [Panicum hallii]
MRNSKVPATQGLDRFRPRCASNTRFRQLKLSAHSLVQDSPFQMDDIYSLVSSKAPRDLAPEKKRKICEAIRKVLGGVPEVLGIFIQELAFAEDGDPAESSVRRSKRGRTVKSYKEEDEEIEEDLDYEAEEEEDFYSSDERSLGLDSEDEADHATSPTTPSQ